ncbi:MAG TPA: monovalent cation:proton antiporter-2 (CPA2) family protein, partial [Burkholderiales bacterium]|nr:monovalent cation:proton antiporter-2 (CPA2) family protein [Burkholderiales bacterium]
MRLLEQAVVFLATAVILVPLFQRFKLGAVLGYLVAGMAIGPWGFGMVSRVEETLDFAEFGVVLLLFLVGLELEPERLRSLRRPIFGLGGAQVACSAAALTVIGIALGMDWRAAAVAGAGFAMSSTALVLASLAERDELSSAHGRETFAVLLFQDLAVIPMLAILPLLAGETAQHGDTNFMLATKALFAIVVVVAGGRLVVRPALKLIATYGSREVFTAAALLLVVGAALVMERLGLSMSLGAFLAGVLLADSEFRHELEADIEPFKGLLMGLFFIAVGMSADLGLLIESPLRVLGVAAGLMAVKFAVMYAISRIAGGSGEHAQRVAVALSEGGEFAFVLFSTAGALGVLAAPQRALLVMAVTVSMLLAPPLFALHRRAAEAWRQRTAPPEFDAIDEPGNPVIIAGYGRFGQIVSRVLRMCGIAFTAVDANYQQVDFVRRFGNKIYYGDATRIELLHAAKAREAKLFVLAIDDVEASVKAAALVRKHFPALPVLARARNRVHYFRLRDLGIHAIYRETLASSLEVAHQSLLRLGMSLSLAQHAISLFRAHDEEQLNAQYAVHQDEDQYMQTTRQAA